MRQHQQIGNYRPTSFPSPGRTAKLCFADIGKQVALTASSRYFSNLLNMKAGHQYKMENDPDQDDPSLTCIHGPDRPEAEL